MNMNIVRLFSALIIFASVSLMSTKPINASYADDVTILIQPTLTRTGIFSNTNHERTLKKLPLLKANSTLNDIAARRAADMFKRQYFAHVSPSGHSAQNDAKDVHYAYITIGENIALGDFENDAALLRAWMKSPGHRANILSKSYSEMGVAVVRGTYKNETTWIGVQIFARPQKACPTPSAQLKNSIDELKKSIQQKDTLINTEDARLSSLPQISLFDSIEYDDSVQKLNKHIAERNTDARVLKTRVATYNHAVEVFNACLLKYSNPRSKK